MNDYPTEEQLDRISQWDIAKAGDLPAYVASIWHWDDRAKETAPGLWAFSTGGWSGNEEILDVMEHSMAWVVLGWNSLYVPGGLMIIATSPEAIKEMGKLHDRITKWAWSGGKRL